MPSPSPSTPLSSPLPPSVSPSTLSHFSRLPIAVSTLQDPRFTIYPMSRHLTHSGHGHTLMAKTWNTDDTITQLMSLYRPPDDDDSVNGGTGGRAGMTFGEVRRFYTFGSGLNAHPDLLHGGVVGCLLDSSMGNAVGFALPLIDTGKSSPEDALAYTSGAGAARDQSESSKEKKGRDRETVFTAQLNITYKGVVRTPGTVRVRSWVVRVEGEGRKVWVEGVVERWGDGRNEGNGEGEGRVVVCARAEGLWVRSKVKGGKL